MFFAKDRPLCFKPQSISRYDSPPGQSLGALPVGFRFPLWETTLFFRWNRYLPPSYSPLTSFGNSYSYTDSDIVSNRSCPPAVVLFPSLGGSHHFRVRSLLSHCHVPPFGQFSMLLLVLVCLPILIFGRLFISLNLEVGRAGFRSYILLYRPLNKVYLEAFPRPWYLLASSTLCIFWTADPTLL